MRPKRLVVEGLRSHARRTEVVFPERWDLAAVVGPTGAGKSSLLEAVVFALYGSGTVPNASQPSKLLADEAGLMRVVLEFAVDDRQYRITRSYRRTGSPPPLLELPDGARIDGVEAVDREIVRVLGLSQGVFCQTALLPQGRFARLLEASATNQRQILEEFFRLAELSETAKRIAAAGDALDRVRERALAARRELPADPAGEVAAARRLLDDAVRAATRAGQVLDEVTRHRAAASEARRAAAEADARAAAATSASERLRRHAEAAAELALVATRYEEREQAVAGELQDARAALAAAQQRLVALDPARVARERSLVDALVAAVHGAEQASARAAEAMAELRRVTDQLDVAARLAADAATLAESAAAARRAAADRAAEAEARHRTVGERVAAVRRAADHLARVEARLEQAEQGYTAARRLVDDAVAAAAAAEHEAARAGESRDRLRRAADAARADAARARSLVDGFAEVLDAAERARRRFDEATAAHDEAVARFEEASSAAAAAAEVEAAAVAARDQAEARLAGAQRAAAAAVAAEGCVAGDGCPVCGRPLPDDFAPPEPPDDLHQADAAARAAREAVADAAGAAAAARARSSDAAAALDRARQLLDATRRDEVAASADLRDAGGAAAFEELRAQADQAAQREAELAAAAAESEAAARSAQAAFEERARGLGPLREIATARAAERDEATAARDEARAALAEADARLAEVGGDAAVGAAEAALTAALDAVRVAEHEADRREQDRRAADRAHAALREQAAGARAAETAARHAVEAAESAVDAAVRAVLAILPAPPSPGDRAAVVLAAEAAVSAAEAAVADAQRAAAAASDRVAAAEGAAAAVAGERATLLDTPLAELVSVAARDAAVAGGVEVTPPRTAAALRSWCAQYATRADEAAAADRSASATALAAARAAEAEVERLAAQAGVAPDGLAAWRSAADEQVGERRRALATAEAAQARCDELDGALAASEPRARLLEAGRALSKGAGNFVVSVLAARRRHLVVEAAGILQELSGGRLTFDHDAVDRFEVIDQRTGATRDPRLLSGGEQFQSSLSLALALVEIAARGGSRIETLFLDEGFAALDQASLDIALDALETAASRGRQIVAVTHVDAVTARCDHVLEVTPTPSGSQVRWRDPLAI